MTITLEQNIFHRNPPYAQRISPQTAEDRIDAYVARVQREVDATIERSKMGQCWALPSGVTIRKHNPWPRYPTLASLWRELCDLVYLVAWGEEVQKKLLGYPYRDAAGASYVVYDGPKATPNQKGVAK